MAVPLAARETFATVIALSNSSGRCPRSYRAGAHTKSGGRKTYAEARPEVVAFAKELRGSLRKRSAELAARGFMNELGNAFSAASISSMLRLSDSARV
jgi:hypothetical protein